jgi:hypothetical protein
MPEATAQQAEKGNGRAEIDAAHAALGTEPQDVYDGDEPDVLIVGSGQLSFSVGGKRPTTSGLRLVGGKLDVEGSFTKGETVVLRVEAVVGEVAFIDQVDAKTDQVVGCERRHKARIRAVSVDS